MLSVYRELIFKEIQNADYVAIICEGTNDKAKKQQLYLIHRYVQCCLLGKLWIDCGVQ
jgi:hypothetical protein